MVETVWQFNTRNFNVALEIEPEELDPTEHFDDCETVEMIRDGRIDWFCARVVVYAGDTDVGSDILGACAYYKVSDFYTSHRDADPMNRNCSIMRAARGQNTSMRQYFPSMVSEAIKAARATLADMPKLRKLAA